jgi:hypothetical protein
MRSPRTGYTPFAMPPGESISDIMPCQLDKNQPQKLPTNEKRSQRNRVNPFPRILRCKCLISKPRTTDRTNPSILIDKRGQSKQRHNQTVNIRATKNPRFAPFHDAPKNNFISFAVPSPASQECICTLLYVHEKPAVRSGLPVLGIPPMRNEPVPHKSLDLSTPILQEF